MKPYDIVLFGATGFTGRLVLEHFKRALPAGMRLAVAGRSATKLEAVVREVGVDVPILIADAHDAKALAAVAAATRVVATTVGPYAKYGLPLVEACVEHGTHYCDLTGEVTFMRQSIDTFHARALERKACIVHATGFDSIPADLGVMVAARVAKERKGASLASVRSVYLRLRGGASGGTLQSAMLLAEAARKDPSVRKLLMNPNALVPDAPPLRSPSNAPESDPSLGVLGLFVMAAVNTQVVRRSYALGDHAYGLRFDYREVQSYGRGAAGYARAYATTAAVGAALGLAALPRTRALLERWLPKPGEGPSEQQRTNGYFDMRVQATLDGVDDLVEVDVHGDGDPGYLATARMIGQTAVGLAEATPPAFGVRTPASSLGERLVSSLAAHGVTFTPRGA